MYFYNGHYLIDLLLLMIFFWKSLNLPFSLRYNGVITLGERKTDNDSDSRVFHDKQIWQKSDRKPVRQVNPGKMN